MPPDSFPSSVQPMLPTLSKAPFSNPDWLFEPKWDGFRAVWFLRDGEVRLVSRRPNDLTGKFPEPQSIAQSIKASSAVLDWLMLPYQALKGFGKDKRSLK